MTEIPLLWQYLVKLATGAMAFVVWLLSVISPPILVLDPAVQGVLVAAFIAAFGWGIVQGGQAVRSDALRAGKR
jgi:hypothetical protein